MSDLDLRHVARLARLHIDPKDLERFASQIGGILDFVDELKSVDVKGAEPTSHPLAISNVFREDAERPSLSIQEFLKHSPASRGRFFQVPKVIEDKS